MKHAALFSLLLISLFVDGCNRPPDVIRVATTTSTENSGLLDVLLPMFREETGITVHVLSQGTGKALKSGEFGNVDLVFVHARTREDEFVSSGFGVNRRDVMRSSFVIIGPPDDPAGISGMVSPMEAFKKIVAAKSTFCSRGDESGTHLREKAIWQKAGIKPKGPWYLDLGKGMGAALIVANEKSAYILTDSGTYISFKNKINLSVLVKGHEMLENPYGIIAVNPRKHDNVNYDGAMKFINWITSPVGQAAINSFQLNGEQLFFGNAD